MTHPPDDLARTPGESPAAPPEGASTLAHRHSLATESAHPALKAAVEGAFRAMIADGTYKTILEKSDVANLSIAN